MHPKHQETVRAAAVAAGAVGVPGAFSFGLDITAMAGIWTTMVAKIAKDSGHDLNAGFAAKLAMALATGVGAYVGGSKLATTMLHAIPGAGTLTAIGINSCLNYWFTYRVGRALAGIFERPSLDLMDAGEVALCILPNIVKNPTGSELREVFDLAARQ